MKRKVISVIISILAIASVAGCAGSNQTASTGQSSVSKETPAPKSTVSDISSSAVYTDDDVVGEYLVQSTTNSQGITTEGNASYTFNSNGTMQVNIEGLISHSTIYWKLDGSHIKLTSMSTTIAKGEFYGDKMELEYTYGTNEVLIKK